MADEIKTSDIADEKLEGIAGGGAIPGFSHTRCCPWCGAPMEEQEDVSENYENGECTYRCNRCGRYW